MPKRERGAVVYVEAGDERKERIMRAVELLKKEKPYVNISTLTIDAIDEKLARLASRYPELRAA